MDPQVLYYGNTYGSAYRVHMEVPTGCLWNTYGVQMRYLLGMYRILMECPWGYLCGAYGGTLRILMGDIWGAYKLLMGVPMEYR
jgi:hypothetical protein